MKLLSSIFDAETGVSTVIIQTELGIFQGRARLHPDDQDNISNLAGCRIAEERAILKYLKTLLKYKKIEFKTLNHIYKDLYDNNAFDDKIFHRLNLQLRDRTNEINVLKEEMKNIEDYIQKIISLRDKIFKGKKGQSC